MKRQELILTAGSVFDTGRCRLEKGEPRDRKQLLGSGSLRVQLWARGWGWAVAGSSVSGLCSARTSPGSKHHDSIFITRGSLH